MVRKFATSMVLAASFLTLPAIVGCDREVAKETKVTENSRGGTKVEEKKTVEKSDGSVETTKETKKINP